MSVLDDFLVTDQVALVTGAGKGIGAAIALALADAGADVAITARTEADLEKVAAQIRERGRRALVLPADVSDLDALPALVERTVAEFGGIDILVNNAGGTMSKPFLDTKAKHLQSAFTFNVVSPFELSRIAVPHMLERGGGVILNVASMAGVNAQRGQLMYGTAKAAFNHLTRLMAQDLGPRIRVNAVLPGAVETDALKWYLDQKDASMRETMRERTTMRRNGVPNDIATAALYLCSPASAWVTGKLVQVDGGANDDLIPSPLPDL